jgi:hypothetical protein
LLRQVWIAVECVKDFPQPRHKFLLKPLASIMAPATLSSPFCPTARSTALHVIYVTPLAAPSKFEAELFYWQANEVAHIAALYAEYFVSNFSGTPLYRNAPRQARRWPKRGRKDGPYADPIGVTDRGR